MRCPWPRLPAMSAARAQGCWRVSADFQLSFETTGRLPVVGAGRRREILALSPTAAVHGELLGAVPLFREIEVAAPPDHARPPPERARIAFWNVERCKYLSSSVDLLAGVGADVNLLCEMDLGMARSRQLHTTREIANRLSSGYVFAAEFLELGLGDEREREWHSGAENTESVHGAAIVSRHALERPALVRLVGDGAWFDGANGERRVGGRIALAATVRVAGRQVAVVSVHFESHGSPADRARQMGALLAALDSYAPDMPVVVGGDFNTSTVDRDPFWGPDAKRPLIVENPDRLIDPIAYEPLFELAADAGYDWERANVLGAATMRTRPDGTPAPPMGKIDWFFTRGLDATDPEVVAAVDGNDATAISDHDLLAVTVSPQQAGESQ